MKNDSLTKLTKARSALILDNPFFGSLAVRLKFVERTNMTVHGMQMRTMAVDGKHLYYHPEFVDKLSFEHLKFVVAHEVMHCVWNHCSRLLGRDPAKWNKAGDYVINDMLKKLKDKKGNHCFQMPPMGLWSEEFEGPEWSADSVYVRLPDDPDGPGPGQKGGAFDHVLGGSGGESSEEGQQMDAADRSQLEREWKVATLQAANAARMAGRLPADLERFLDDLYKPQVNWQERLRNFVNEVTRNDYDWTRPNRRFSDVYMPSLRDESVGEIAVVIDDSGSIDQATLNAFGAEIKGIMEDVRPSLTHLLYCDAEVSAHYRLEADDTPVFKCHGGGGTDFRPPFDKLAEEDIVPKCLVYLTDLQGPHGKEPPYPVLWVSVTESLVAPWGETLYIKPYPEEGDD